MADNRFFNNQKVFVEADYNNIILVDPNKVVGRDNIPQERLVNHEELVMYANLEANVLPRSKLVVGSNFDDISETQQVATLRNEKELKINFISPKGKGYLDTSWSDQITGKGSLEGGGTNQTKFIKDGDKVVKNIVNNEDTQLLGITRITIKLNPSYVPQVTIEMVDVQGRVLFEQGENSPYSAFMQLPYPLFTLTLKGYFGKAMRFELMLKDFNATFDPSDGNYKITTNYVARSHALLADIALSHLFALPHMFPLSIEKQGNTTAGNTTQQTAQSQNLNQTTTTDKKYTTKGLQKLDEVYRIYKNRGLIDEDFPHISLNVLVDKLERFNEYIMSQYSHEDMSVLTDIVNYSNLLVEYRDGIFGNKGNNWFNKYIDKKNIYIQNKDDLSIIYQLKDNTIENRKTAISDLNSLINEFNDKLKDNATFGVDGNYTIDSKKHSDVSIPIDIKLSDVLVEISSLDSIDFEETYRRRIGKPTDQAEYDTFKINENDNFYNDGYVVDVSTLEVEGDNNKKTFFIFGDNLTSKSGINTFLSKISAIDNTFNDNKDIVEKKLSKALAKKIKSTDNGIGFEPTINNVMAVVCASSDAFMRLMDDIHDIAWDKRDSKIRIDAIIKPQSSDAKKSVKTSNIDGKTEDKTTIFPWPQYYEKQLDKDGNVEYVLKYPGSKDSINQTQGYLTSVWPEIQFVEEYIKAKVINQKETLTLGYGNPLETTKQIPFNTIEYPFGTLPYGDTTMVNYFYEIFERSYLLSNYNKLYKVGNNTNFDISSVLGDFEYINIEETAIESPKLVTNLKNYAISGENILDLLQNINNSNSSSWSRLSRGNFVTTYIRSDVEETNSSNIFSVDTINENSLTMENNSESTKKLKSYLASTKSDDLTFLDVYPFTNLVWAQNNLSDGESVSTLEKANSTTTSLFFDEKKKVISNVDINNEKEYHNKPLTYFEWINNTSNNPQQADQITTNQQLIDFYDNRTFDRLILTESYVDYGTTTNVTSEQTTSLLNTPYFVNAIIEGVDNESNGVDNPYVALGYLVLNSLPLSTLKEKLKTYDSNTTTNGDYFYAELTKLSAIHRLPYYLILKYGSLWHRYKTKKVNDTDILTDTIWTDFDYVNGYDPINGTTSKKYTIENYIGNNEDIYLSKILQDYHQIQSGFYPKVINSIYKYFTKLDVFTTYSDDELVTAQTTKNLKIGKINDSEISLDGYSSDNPTRILSFNNWFQYFEIKDNTDFVDYENDWVLVVPSFGYSNFNQSEFECFKNDKMVQDITSNKVFNGSVRSLWGASNFGYFDNDKVSKPLTTQYLKSIDAGSDNPQPFNLLSNQSDYASIEEIFAVFEKETLDIFETHFLNFCQPTRNSKSIVNNQTQSVDYFLSDTNFRYDYNLEEFMKSLFMIEKPTLVNETTDAKNITKNQTNSFVNKIKDKILEYDVVLKIGNVGNFNRKVFGSFTDDNDFKITDPMVFGAYVNGTLPGDGSGINLVGSVNNNSGAWEAMYLYIGEYTGTNLIYGDTGSYYTDFFIDNNIEFTEANVKNLAQIIKIYASKKLEDSTITSASFLTDFNEFLTEQQDFQNKILNHTFSKFKDLPTITEVDESIGTTQLDGNVIGNELWYVFKNMNDKWISGQDFKNRLIFEDMLFLDRANRPIGDKLIINIDELRGFLNTANATSSVYTLIGDIAEKNQFAFMPVPAYNNFYGRNTRIKDAQPIPQDIPNNLFGTFMNVDIQDSRPKLLCIHVGKPSEYLAMEKNHNYMFGNDAFDFTRADMLINNDKQTDYSKANRCVGFNVDFGTRNQGLFKSVSIDMSQRKNIAPTFQILEDMGKQVSGQKVSQQSTSLYSYYKSMSYTCNVTAMGNVMIQPTMYFNLKHVPMFYGPYLILNVTHDISTSDFTTQFEGIRVPLFSLEPPTDLVASVNDLISTYKHRINKRLKEPTEITETTEENTGTKETPENKGSTKGSGCEPITQYANIDFASDMTTSRITESALWNIINSYDFSYNLKLFLLGVAKMETNFNPINNNFYNTKTNKDWGPLGKKYIKEQFCGKNNIPYVSFISDNHSIEMMGAYFKNHLTDQFMDNFYGIDNTILYVPTIMAEIWFRDWYFGKSPANPPDYISFKDSKESDTTSYREYQKMVEIFEYVGSNY